MKNEKFRKNKFILFRDILIIKPLSILTIIYIQDKELFKMFVYNSKLGELFRKELTL